MNFKRIKRDIYNDKPEKYSLLSIDSNRNKRKYKNRFWA